MELKKSEEANIDKMRMPIVMVGLLFTGSLVLASFSYTSAVENTDNMKGETQAAVINTEEEAKKEDTPPPAQTPQVEAPMPVAEDIVEEENTETEPVAQVEVIPTDLPSDETVIAVEEEIIEFPDVEAAFPGGPASMQKWIAENVQYPETSIDLNEQGRVYLSFVVETDGSISNIAIERGVSTDLDKEAKRLLRNMPAWAPGEAKGKKSRTRCRLPINFTLN
jgi:protein TonB